ncbi:MAG: chorismate-binding protein, partial [Flavisolibacter sp.]|nr:chorismate-binding protein [Flavisolibacter sp.]
MKVLDAIFNDITTHWEKKLPFALYSKPGERNFTVLLQENAATHLVSDFREKGFVFAPFADGVPLLIPEDAADISGYDYEVHDEQKEFDQAESGISDESAFVALVSRAVNCIKEGQFTKVVLSRNEIVPLENFKLSETYLNILTRYPAAFRYCFFHPQAGLWMGATPELLIKADDTNFATVALAGTQRINSAANVIWMEKERQEHIIVTDCIVEALRTIAHDVKISETKTHSAGNLIHLKTDIRGTMTNDAGVKELVQSLHPTPAICGMPKSAAKKFISANEGYDREYYSGYLG